MEYFVAQVRTHKEAAFIRLTDHLELPGVRRLFWPRRMLKIRRRGIVKRAEVPVFPGYVFLEGDTITAETYQKLKRLPNFLRFLPDNEDVRPLGSEDKRVIAQLVSYGEVVQPSRVTFDENSRILVLEGPLKGLEGRISKVDRRKGRAKVKLDLYDDSFEVDFAFESMEKIKPRKNER
ncbi:MAG: antiterminator LoaP [Spirochaetes bacterium]|jgi:transcriptional antiterminator NusG|nr:antiterminator LoaP [Spirochaetota bacterium]